MKVAIVDDELDMRQSISQWLVLSGYDTETFASARDALKVVGPGYPGVVLSDIRMPDIDGMTFLKRLMHHDSALPVVLITGHGDVPMAVEAMRIGAYDFLEKPFDPEQMTDIVQRACAARKLALENRALRNELASGDAATTRLIGESPAMVRLREDILDLAQADAPVLIDGETGTGKTLVARALHAVGARASRPLVQVFCGHHDEAGQIRRLFGDGTDDVVPAVVEARNGFLLLEDVQVLAPAAQARLVSWLDDPQAADAPRVVSICGTDGESTCGDLRPDLYHRLSALHLTLPPLRQRGDDILLLFKDFTANFAGEYGAPPPQISPHEAAQLLQAPWPGNVRQLMNVAERAVMQNRRGSGSLTSLLISDNEAVSLPMTHVTQEGKPLKEYVEAFERMLIDNTMRRHQGSIARVMEELCLPRRTLNEKMAKYGLVRSHYT